MKGNFSDIINAAGTKTPKWWDENGVPRFCDFHPHEVSNIYADEVVLMEIACQSCGDIYHVAMSSKKMDAESQRDALIQRVFIYAVRRGEVEMTLDSLEAFEKKYEHIKCSLADHIREGTLHYGDPPNTGCCASGASMNSLALRVLEYWKRESYQWVRNPELEIAQRDKAYYEDQDWSRRS